MLLHGRRQSNRWWQPARWTRWEPELAGWLVERLEVFRRLILAVRMTTARPALGMKNRC
jgi:uncharacterized protein YggT (Ycf19 family)